MKRVCKYHGIEVSVKEDVRGHRRFYCKKCKKFLFNYMIVELEAQEFYILQLLNQMDDKLGQIWDIAFHHPIFPKMIKGIPEHGLSDVFIKLHESQRSILGWDGCNVPRGF